MWDFDRAIGNTESPLAGNPEDWRVRLTPWFARLFEDPAFEARVKARWAEMKAGNEFDEIQAYIDERAVFMQDAQARNFQRWPILGTWLDTTRVVPGTYDGEISVMKEWLRARIAWVITLTCVLTALVPQITTQSASAMSSGLGPASRPVPAR